MGNQSSDAQMLRYIQSEWQMKASIKNKQIFYNNKLQKYAQTQGIILDPSHQIEHQMNIYNYRRKQSNALVQVYSILISKQDTTVCGNSQSIKVYHQHIPQRLGQIQHLSQAEAIYVLSQSMRGFSDCFNKVGYFDINAHMIGINSNGFVKVWLNQNFAQNHPLKQITYLQMVQIPQKQKQTDDSKKMIRQLVEIIQKKSNLNVDLKSKILTKQNFPDAYNAIQRYCKQKQLLLPDRLRKIQLKRINSFSLIPQPNQGNKSSQINQFNQVNKVSQLIPVNYLNQTNQVNNSITRSQMVRPIQSQQIIHSISNIPQSKSTPKLFNLPFPTPIQILHKPTRLNFE